MASCKGNFISFDFLKPWAEYLNKVKPCSTRHQDNSTSPFVSYEVEHSKKNSISICAHVSFSIYHMPSEITKCLLAAIRVFVPNHESS